MSSDFYKFEIFAKLVKLKNYLQILKSRHYSNTSPVNLAGDLQKILSVIEKNIDSIPIVLLPELNSFLEREFLSLCSIIEKSTPSYIPWSLIPELEELSSRLISSGESVIIRAENYFNYSIHVFDIISNYLSELRLYVGNIDELREDKYIKPRIFTIPLLEKNNVLLHSILFHEIGHFYEKKFSNSNEINKFVNETIAGLIKEEQNYTLFIASEATNILKGFIREIYSDIFALYCCGVPMLFSTYHFLKSYPEPSLPNSDNNFYPPMKYRLRILYNICIKEKTKDELAKRGHNAYKALLLVINDIDKILNYKNDIDLLTNTNEPSLIATKAFEKIIDLIVKDVKTNTKSHLNDFDNVDILFDKLIESIPPCEIDGVPQDITKILTSGWAAYYHLYEHDNISKSYDKLNTINLLCLKALTQSFFFRKFIKAKNGNIN